METEGLSDFFEEADFRDATSSSFSNADVDIFSVLEAWETVEVSAKAGGVDETNHDHERSSFEFQNSSAYNLSFQQESDETELPAPSKYSPPHCKRQKLIGAAASAEDELGGQHRVSHITVERNRRKQMNEHLSVLRSLMPCFYVKRGDQASIIGGVVDYIHELQQVLQSLEAKKQRKAYTEVLSPRPVSSPRPLPLSPRKPPLSQPISPSTPQPSSPYKPWMHQQQQLPVYLNSPSLPSPVVDPSPCNSSTSSINDAVNELVANSKSAVAEVEVKFSGPNLLLKTVSHRIPGQAVKIISALEELALEILHVSISTVEETMLNSFTIKIGIECQLSAEELAQQIQQTFC
ncbi:transcription factor SPEECHLESS [Sesamum indicum]|uniref:Transcription factor SPEECHLESS n=1 Tax=Sesamum indicum TaxID=4182 RepID=A0A6I9TT78_SESIN|nr:transcription factor SPEECHLESS [Sesamum indicum]